MSNAKSYKLATLASLPIEQTYPSRGSAGSLEWALEGYATLRRLTLHSLKGIFTREEMLALTDRGRSLLVQQWHMGRKDVFLSGISDFQRLENGVREQGADYAALVQKVKSLSEQQIYFLEDEINRFWNDDSAYGSPTPDFEKFYNDWK